MNSKDLAYWRADAEQTQSIEALKDKIEWTAINIKCGLNRWFYEALLQIYLYELKWRTADTTSNRFYQSYYLG